MAKLKLSGVDVDFPIYGANARRLLSKQLFDLRTGGILSVNKNDKVEVSALRSIDLDISEGDRLGLIGHNGAGKTTLLRVMAGILRPTRGEIEREGRISPMFDIGLGMMPDATGIENASMIATLFGMRADEIEEALAGLADFTELGDYLYLPVRTYSAGMQTRLAFGIATLQSPEVILLDEGLYTGDAAFASKAGSRLREFYSQSSIMVVASHAEHIIRRMCNRVAWMHKGEISFLGDVDEGYERYYGSLDRETPKSTRQKGQNGSSTETSKPSHHQELSIDAHRLWAHKSHGGEQAMFEHQSSSCDCTMRFTLYLPPQSKDRSVPLLIWLGGQGNGADYFVNHCAPQEYCSRFGIALAAPDVSPTGKGVPDSPFEFDFAIGAGYFVDATQEPWARNFQMYSYVARELPLFMKMNFPVDTSRVGLMGHSMGGHGALTIGLRNPETFKSLSAFAPYCSLSRSESGRKALLEFLGPEEEADWRSYDAVRLLEDGHKFSQTIVVDQGADDHLLHSQINYPLLVDACKDAGQDLDLQIHDGYDHSTFFVRSFLERHFDYHAKILVGKD